MSRMGIKSTAADLDSVLAKLSGVGLDETNVENKLREQVNLKDEVLQRGKLFNISSEHRQMWFTPVVASDDNKGIGKYFDKGKSLEIQSVNKSRKPEFLNNYEHYKKILLENHGSEEIAANSNGTNTIILNTLINNSKPEKVYNTLHFKPNIEILNSIFPPLSKLRLKHGIDSDIYLYDKKYYSLFKFHGNQELIEGRITYTNDDSNQAVNTQVVLNNFIRNNAIRPTRQLYVTPHRRTVGMDTSFGKRSVKSVNSVLKQIDKLIKQIDKVL